MRRIPGSSVLTLIADESEVLPEGKDEILHVVDDGVLHRPLVHVLPVADAQFLHVDEVEEILVLERVDRARVTTRSRWSLTL